MTKPRLRITASLLVVFFLTPLFAAHAQPQQNTKMRYRDAKKQYTKEVDFYKSRRQEFLTARRRFQAFKNKPEMQEQYKEKAGAFLEKSIDVLIRRLSTVISWVENRKSLDEETRREIISELEKDIAWLEEKKGGITEATLEEIRQTAKEIREYWREHRKKTKSIIARIWSARLDASIERFEKVYDRVENKIEELKEEGKDTSDLESLASDLREKIDLAKEQYEKAKDAYKNISSAQEADALFRKAHQFIRDGHRYLKEAHQTLREIIQKMKEL